MTKTLTGLAIGIGLSSASIASAGPCTPSILLPTAASNAPTVQNVAALGTSPTVAASVTYESVASGPFNAVAATPSTAYEAFVTGDESGSDQHPMIPLPPAVWAGLASLAGVAYHTIRQQRPARVRR